MLSSLLLFHSIWLLACGSGNGATCEPGQLACACRAAGECDEGLACVDQQCLAPSEVSLEVSDPEARSCEVLLRETDPGRVVGARFAPAVTGAHLRQAPHSAVSFFGHEDTAIGAGAVSLLMVSAANPAVEVSRARCFDRAGEPLAGATVRINH